MSFKDLVITALLVILFVASLAVAIGIGADILSWRIGWPSTDSPLVHFGESILDWYLTTIGHPEATLHPEF